MKKKAILTSSAMFALVLLLITMLSGCSGKNNAAETAGPVGSPETYAGGGLTGTWQTASMGYEDDGTMYPEYYVKFTDSDIVYGHMKNGAFVSDHSDRIICFEQTAAGGFKIQAKAFNGVQYTYQTCESDNNVLEYYETWQEEDFPEMYRGGASLTRCY